MKKISRRKFIALSAMAAAAEAFPRESFGQSVPPKASAGSKKKGLGLGVRSRAWPSALTDLRCKWCYNWMGALPAGLPAGVEFIPMIRSKFNEPERVARVAEDAKAAGITELLGLNEPDAAKQDDMSVDQALELWPLLMETGMRLGSPGCVHPDKEWMTAFMEGVEERKLRVDFVCVHSYGGPDAKALVKRLERIHSTYNRPLWITEFGVGDWSAQAVEDNRYAAETVLNFMDDVLPMLDGLDFLERYAWFPAGTDSPALGTSALFDTEGVLTPLGERYRDA